MTRAYDCLFVGVQPSGLVAAALLAKRGFSVAVVDQGELPEGYTQDGWRFPLGPCLVPNLHQSDAVRRIHQELNAPSPFQAQRCEPFFQAILPRNRLTLPPGPQALIKELQREFPDQAKAAQRFMERLENLQMEISTCLNDAPPLVATSLRERIAQRQWKKSHRRLHRSFWKSSLYAILPEDHPLTTLLLSPLVFLGYLPHQELSLLQAARVLYHASQGLLSFENPLDQPASNLLQMVQAQGVTVHRDTTLEAFEIKGRQIKAATLKDDTPFQPEVVVSNSAGSLEALFPTPRLAARYLADQELLPSVGALVTVNVLVDEDVLPEGIASTLLLLNGRLDPQGERPVDPPVLLRQFPAAPAGRSSGDSRKGSTGRAVLSAACPVSREEMASPAQVDGVKLKILKQLERVVPFLGNYLELTSIPIDSTAPDRRSAASGPAWNIQPIFSSPSEPSSSLAARDIQTPFKNLFRAGRDIIPGLGLEGEYLSGLAVADRVSAQLRQD